MSGDNITTMIRSRNVRRRGLKDKDMTYSFSLVEGVGERVIEEMAVVVLQNGEGSAYYSPHS